jgi:hypothetical protein
LYGEELYGFTPHPIRFGGTNQGGWDGKGMWLLGRGQNFMQCLGGHTRSRDCMEDLGIGGRITLKQ